MTEAGAKSDREAAGRAAREWGSSWWILWGLAAGLLEGVLRLVLQHLEVQPWELKLLSVGPGIVGISTAVSACLFLAAGVAAGLGLRLLGRPPSVAHALAPALAAYLLLSVPFTTRLAEFALVVLSLGLGMGIQRARIRYARSVRWRHSAKTLVAVFGLAAIVLSLGADAARESADRLALPDARADAPDVLMVVMDDLRADHVGAYGYSRPTTPTLDSLARHGVFFRDAIATSSWSLPSHASLLTGRLPSEHGAVWCRPMDREQVTVGEVLSDAGYRTAGFSGNFLFFNRAQRLDDGFQHFEDIFFSLRDRLSRTMVGYQYDRIVSYIEGRPKLARLVLRPLGLRPLASPRSAEDLVDGVLEWVDGVEDRPYFVAVNFFDAHGPELVQPPFRDLFTTDAKHFGYPESISWRWGEPPSERHLRFLVDTYDGALRYMDSQLGRLLSELRARERRRDLLVVVSSDHGEMFGERGFVAHQASLWLPQLRVPLIASYTAKIPAGREILVPVSIASVPGSILSLAGVAVPATFIEPALTPLWSDDTSAQLDWPAPAAELARPAHADRTNPPGWKRSLTTSRWHLLRQEFWPAQIYDRRSDSANLRDVASDPRYADTVQVLRALLDKRLPSPPGKSAC